MYRIITQTPKQLVAPRGRNLPPLFSDEKGVPFNTAQIESHRSSKSPSPNQSTPVFKRPPRLESYQYKSEQRKIMHDNIDFMYKLMKQKSAMKVESLRE